MNNALLRVLGWKATVLHGDPLCYDRYLWLKKHLQPGPLSTLDAGCGNGCFSFYAASVGNRVLGLSFDAEQNGAASERAKLLGLTNAEFRVLDLRDLHTVRDSLGEFDQIILMETIEHVINDRKLVADLCHHLKPGGRLYLTTPYKEHKALRQEYLSETEDGGHVRWGYTLGEVRNIMESCGLEVVAEGYTSGMISQKLTNLMRVSDYRNEKKAWAASFPLRLFQITLDAPLTRAMSYPPFGVGLVGVKKSSVEPTVGSAHSERVPVGAGR
ncbi:MAG: class I SAM-dependent methyltransferase [Capsulimonadales bacterium]|nr:class I SAM-dependent methyltransferase [Capsulimonadales bacterium]